MLQMPPGEQVILDNRFEAVLYQTGLLLSATPTYREATRQVLPQCWNFCLRRSTKANVINVIVKRDLSSVAGDTTINILLSVQQKARVAVSRVPSQSISSPVRGCTDVAVAAASGPGLARCM